jgi:hypothetical protein
MKLTYSVGVLSLGLALAGCSDDTASPDRSPSSSTSNSNSTVAGCRVDGFVPGHRVVLRSSKPEILYAHGVSLAPGSRSRGASKADLLSLPRDAPGVRVSAPAGADLDPGTASAIVRSVGHSSAARLDEVAELSWDLRNRGGSDQSYLVYAGAIVHRGTWRARFCGGGINDGRSVVEYRGSFVAVGPLRRGVVLCRGTLPGNASRLQRHAAAEACG